MHIPGSQHASMKISLAEKHVFAPTKVIRISSTLSTPLAEVYVILVIRKSGFSIGNCNSKILYLKPKLLLDYNNEKMTLIEIMNFEITYYIHQKASANITDK